MVLLPNYLACGTKSCTPNDDAHAAGSYCIDAWGKTMASSIKTPGPGEIPPEFMGGYIQTREPSKAYFGACPNMTTYKKNTLADNVWDPYKFTYDANFKSKPPQHKPELLLAIDRCCTTFGTLPEIEKIKCGSFNPTENGKNVCNSLNIDYCAYGPEDRLKETRCAPYLLNKIVNEKLKTVCRNKSPTDADWKNVCGCYYDPKIYEDIASAIAKEWNGPPNSYSSKPECMYPRCAASDYKNKDTICPPVSFAQCVQNPTISLTRSTVGDIILKTDCTIQGAWSKKDTPVIDPQYEPESGDSDEELAAKSRQRAAAAAAVAAAAKKVEEDKKAAEEDKKAAEEKEKKDTMIIIFIIIIGVAILCVGGYFLLSGNDDNYDDDYNNNEDTQVYAY